MSEYKKRVCIYAIYLCIIASMLLCLLPALKAAEVIETDTFKNTGIITEDKEILQYNVETKLVYTLGDFKVNKFERHPYINEDGITYKFNVNTKELYIDIQDK